MASSAKRIDGIDFWRGLALLMIFIDHVPENVFQHVTQQNFGFSDAAELLYSYPAYPSRSPTARVSSTERPSERYAPCFAGRSRSTGCSF